jgi:hypothetical protein
MILRLQAWEEYLQNKLNNFIKHCLMSGMKLAMLLIILLFLLNITTSAQTPESTSTVSPTNTPELVLSETATPIVSETSTEEIEEDAVNLSINNNDLFDSSDWSQFWPGLILEFIGSCILAILAALIVLIAQLMYQRSREKYLTQKDKRKYLRNIQSEIRYNVNLLQPLADQEDLKNMTYEDIDQLFKYRETNFELIEKIVRLQQATLKTSYWNILILSGLLPSIIDQDLLAAIVSFYHNLKIIAVSTVEGSSPGSESGKGYLAEKTFPAILQAVENGKKLNTKIQEEIDSK